MLEVLGDLVLVRWERRQTRLDVLRLLDPAVVPNAVLVQRLPEARQVVIVGYLEHHLSHVLQLLGVLASSTVVLLQSFHDRADRSMASLGCRWTGKRKCD